MTGDRHSIQETNLGFYRAFEKKDLEAMGQIWSQGTGSLCIHPGGQALRGWEAIGNSWSEIFKNTQYLEIDLELITTEVSGNLAYMVLVENILQVSRGRKIQAQSIATNIFEQLGGRWYLVSHHGSPVLR